MRSGTRPSRRAARLPRGKPIITLHDAELTHALKEVDRAAVASAETAEQVVEILRYAIAGPGVRA